MESDLAHGHLCGRPPSQWPIFQESAPVAFGAGFVAGFLYALQRCRSGNKFRTEPLGGGFGVAGDDPVWSDGFDADAVVVVAAERAVGKPMDDVADGKGAAWLRGRTHVSMLRPAGQFVAPGWVRADAGASWTVSSAIPRGVRSW
ncbi:hypothetical protein ACIOEZ_34535 [Streptomyces sp. NPDC087866]|uniref:hypothetical protein n=1 Tax=Streptomyces sp. NPDC087866 TaxID=3365815 RepID=UPI0037F97E37